MKLEDQINRRIKIHSAGLLKIIALLRDGQISKSEVLRHTRATEGELRAIRKLIEKFPATKRAKKTKRTKTKEPERAPAVKTTLGPRGRTVFLRAIQGQ
jgi:hypothetical protein